MIDKCRPFLDFDQNYIDKVCGLDHNSNVPNVHDEGLMDLYMDIPDYYGMGVIYDSCWDDPMFMLGFSPRTPGTYEGRIQDRKVIGKTNEEIHISVRERYQKDSLWRPRSLYGFKPVHDEERQRWKWVGVKHGQPVTIWEAEFEDDVGNFEHLLSDRFYMLGEYDKEG
ncbi:hypothetical protein NLI96_g10123 [Meripilus lineatus]|uniref:Uncharacterized protein n=1 Tax=Meripilus lineatus TaxID=2056292 RepID=A0AAD5UU93_9APHY|nr:hypothetical protein NLI96_g10123 [Physisporinus lineatus]